MNRRLSLLLVIVATTTACSRIFEPVGPSDVVESGATTIRGRAVDEARPASAGGPAHLEPVKVCVDGMPVCSAVTGKATFVLAGDFSGDVQLIFTGPQFHAALTVPGVRPGETLDVAVDLQARTIRIDARHGGPPDNGPTDDATKRPPPADPPDGDRPDEDDDGSDDDGSDDDEPEEDRPEKDEPEDDEDSEDPDESDDSDDDDPDDGDGEDPSDDPPDDPSDDKPGKGDKPGKPPRDLIDDVVDLL